MTQRFNASGEPDTCLWCGRRFPPEKNFVDIGFHSHCCEQPAPPDFEPDNDWKIDPKNRPPCPHCGEPHVGYHLKTETRYTGRRLGYDGSKFFCTLRCGFAFAERMAELGRRLVHAKGKDWVGAVQTKGDES